jgi:hypothetical protein
LMRKGLLLTWFVAEFGTLGKPLPSLMAVMVQALPASN